MFAAFRAKRWMAAAAAALALGCGIGALARTALAARPASAVPENAVALPAVMYHGLLRDPNLQGTYVIDPALLESDLVYLRENGYTPVHIADLLAWVDGRTELPEKPILLTFDDGAYNNYVYAYPLAQKYGMKMIFAPIGTWADVYSESGEENAAYSTLTWERMREMQDSGLIELQNHTYNLHASENGRLGSGRKKGESEEAYAAVLSADLVKMQERMTAELGAPASCFVYPFGAIGEGEETIVKNLGFRCTLTCDSRISYITRDPESLFGIGRRLRPPDCSSEEFFSFLRQ